MCEQASTIRYAPHPDHIQMNAAGKMSDDKRNEGQLLCDILGLESLVDEITYKLASDAVDEPTSTAILGPFYRHNAPKLSMGSCIVSDKVNEQGDRTWMHGVVTDFLSGKPIEGAVIDVWHTAPNGLYEQQDPDQPEMNLRGTFTTGKDGKYDFYCLRPVPYPIPNDGPAGIILQALDRHPMRPAHIHFLVSRMHSRRVMLALTVETAQGTWLQTHRNADFRPYEQVHRRRRGVRRQRLPGCGLQAVPGRPQGGFRVAL
jgi:protocatechuate 3,4-dioxygenase beta subunit